MLRIRKMLFVWHCVSIGLFATSSIFAAFEYQTGGWSAASANIRVIGYQHLDRLLVNPALMEADIQSQVGLQYHKPFMGLDLQSGSLGAVYKVGNLPVVSGIQYFGDDVYSESSLRSGIAWPIDSTFRMGLGISGHHLSVSGFDSRTTLTVSASLFLQLADDIKLGSALEHLVQLNRSLPVPQRFHFGAEYDSGPVVLMFAIEKEAAIPIEFCTALVTSYSRKWQIAVGYRDLSQTTSLGWRLMLKNYRVHYTWILHPDLPDSHGFGLELLLP